MFCLKIEKLFIQELIHLCDGQTFEQLQFLDILNLLILVKKIMLQQNIYGHLQSVVNMEFASCSCTGICALFTRSLFRERQ